MFDALRKVAFGQQAEDRPVPGVVRLAVVRGHVADRGEGPLAKPVQGEGFETAEEFPVRLGDAPFHDAGSG